MTLMISPRLREMSPLAWSYATLCETQEEVNEWLVDFGLPPVLDLEHDRAHLLAKEAGNGQAAGTESLTMCEGGAKREDVTFARRRDNGTDLSAIVSADAPCRIVTTGERIPKTYLVDTDGRPSRRTVGVPSTPEIGTYQPTARECPLKEEAESEYWQSVRVETT